MSTFSVRFLNGPQVGQVRTLGVGKNRLGRTTDCEVHVPSNGVSKEHAVIEVTEDGKILLSDLGSRNGTFVNGLRVKHQSLKLGDKIMLHDLMLEVIPSQRALPQKAQVAVSGDSAMLSAGLPQVATPPVSGGGLQLPAWVGQAVVYNPDGSHVALSSAQDGFAAAVHSGAPGAESPSADDSKIGRQKTGNPLVDLYFGFLDYIDQVAMPGIYTIVQNMEFKQGLFLFIALFVLTATSVSTVPMLALSKKSIQQESIRRVRTIARNLVAANRVAILERNELSINVKQAEFEDGVTDALILARDGTIMAPANKRGEFSRLPFVNQARREERETESILPDGRLGVAVPVLKYNPDTGVQEPTAFAIVIYDMGSMAMSAAQTLSLFLQILVLSSILGLLLFVILFKVVEHPLRDLAAQLDTALRDGRDDLATPYRHSILEGLVSNINSALSRASQAHQSVAPQSLSIVRRDLEAQNIIRIVTDAAIAIDASDDRIIATNHRLDEIIGGGLSLSGRPIQDIPDFSLQENLKDLIPQMRDHLGQIATSQLPFSGLMYELNGQAVAGANGEAAWYLITLTRVGG